MGQLCVKEGKVAHVVCIEGEVPDRSLMQHSGDSCFSGFLPSKCALCRLCQKFNDLFYTKLLTGSSYQAAFHAAINCNELKECKYVNSLSGVAIVPAKMALTLLYDVVQGLQVPSASGKWRSESSHAGALSGIGHDTLIAC